MSVREKQEKHLERVIEELKEVAEHRLEWARSLDAEAGSLRKQLQAIYGSLGYRISRRLGLAPGPRKEPPVYTSPEGES